VSLDRPDGSAAPLLLEARDVRVRFGGFQALDGVSLGLPRGRITGLIGPNGAGKSTLLNVLGGSQRTDTGDVLFAGRSIATLPAWRRSRRGLTRSFQISRELDSLTVLENVLLAGRDQPDGIWDALARRAHIRRSEQSAIERARALLLRVKLWQHADALAGSLSGGQKKLLELARALFTEPQVVLLDEPAAGVNPSLVGELAEDIRAINQEMGITFGIVEHNMDMIAALCHGVYVLAAGRVLVHGSYEEVRADRAVVEAYLGQAA
jgi:ABC-type branched-subunit amino acid transport system ATPase component